MARPLVIDPEEHTRVPFLRGILTRSLRGVGLDFEEAYGVASRVRDDLADTPEITTDELRRKVLKRLKPFGREAVERYRRPGPLSPTILVESRDGAIRPYSRGRHRLSLQTCGLTTEESTAVAARIFDELIREGRGEITSRELAYLTYGRLLDDLGDEAARHYLVWKEFQHSERPLIILIGGTVGSGKSTIATQLAHELDIVRTQSTDMLREVMRVMIPKRLVPVLHKSSYNAASALPVHEGTGAERLLEVGYMTQVELLSLACEAVIARALRERVSVILEGVHVHPALLDRFPGGSDAIFVPVTLAILKSKELRKRIKGRGKVNPDRRAERYLEHFDAIWSLQSFLLSEADRLGVPIVANVEKEESVRQVIGILMDVLSETFAGTPDEVFV
jgi:2-phosphoglycerate kinase